MEVSKSEWKLFRSKIVIWQEAYMEKLIKEYIELLNGDESSSHKFWKLYKRMNKDKKKPGVCLEMRRQDVVLCLARLTNDDTISYADLEGFSEETSEVVKHLATVMWN
jgi:hypothetical protein